jgi:hypothetical protein
MVIGGLVSSVQDQYSNSLLEPNAREGFTAEMSFPSYLHRLPEGGVSRRVVLDASRVRHFPSYIFRRLRHLRVLCLPDER